MSETAAPPEGDLFSRLKADGVTQLWVIYHDYSGRPQVKATPADRFAEVIARGVNFAKANLDHNVLDEQVPDVVFDAPTGDFLAVPDPASYALLPHRPNTARTYSFLHDPAGNPWLGCPRAALQRIADEYTRAGLSVRAAFESECCLLIRSGTQYQAADRSRMFTVDGLEQYYPMLATLGERLDQMDVRLEQVAPEYGPGQYEFSIRPSPPLKAADSLMTLKEVLRELARQAQVIVTFMPKPYASMPGNGLHTHIGITHSDGRNAITGQEAGGLSRLGAAFVGGLLAHAPALCGLGAPTVNSYKRLLPGSWAPGHVCFGVGNRAALVRIPDTRETHVEFRAGDNTCNPYLLLTGLLAAGLDGIENDLDPGAPMEEDVGHFSSETAEARGVPLLPRSAPAALDALQADGVIMSALGPLIGQTFLRLKRSEAATYAIEVGDWERSAYLESP